MKRVRMGLLALSAISSIGSAFAFSPAAKQNATTYYAIRNSLGTSFRWTTVQPTSACDSTPLQAVCTITTANKPQDNKVPAAHASEIDMTAYH